MGKFIAFWPNERVNLGTYGSCESAFRAICHDAESNAQIPSEMIPVKKGVWRVTFSRHNNGYCDYALIVTEKAFNRDYASYKDVLEKPLGEWTLPSGRMMQLLRK